MHLFLIAGRLNLVSNTSPRCQGPPCLASSTLILFLSILGWSNPSSAQEPKPALKVADVLTLAIAAMGGESKWNRVQTIELQSRSVTSIGDKISQELQRLKYQQFPDKEWIEESQQGNWVRTIFRSAEKNVLSKTGKSRKVFSDLKPESPSPSIA